jgi:hypothetical protein
MNSNIQIENAKTQDNRINNINMLMKQINASVTIDEKLKRRTRNGGFIAWPQVQTRAKKHHSILKTENA